MFWRLFVKDIPSLDSALEGIVFKEGKGRFFRRFWKKRLLAYDEVTKCLRYYTPQRVLKGTIHLCDILFITPGRSAGRDVRKDSVFEITVPGRVYVFHVNNIRETKKWIGILSRELDNLQIRDRIQLNNGNLKEATYSKTLRPNSVLLSSLQIGNHREHEECCFLFDEEHQHKIIALESLCSLQAMKIYELSHSVEKIQKKCDDLETPTSEEIKMLQGHYNKLRVNFEREKLQVLNLKATIEEQEVKEQDKLVVRTVEKHQHMDFVKVLHVEKGGPSKPKKTTQNSNSPSFVNLPNSDKNRMEEIQKLQAELEHTKAILTQERARALNNPFQSVNFNSPTPSPLFFDTRVTTTTTTTTSSTSSAINPSRSPSSIRASTPTTPNSVRLHSIPENAAINKLMSSSYKTFSPTSTTNSYLDYQRDNSPTQSENSPYVRTPSPPKREHSPFQLSTHPPASPKPQKSQQTSLHLTEISDTTPILSPQPRYPTSTQPLPLELPANPTPCPQESIASEPTNSISSDDQTTSPLRISSSDTKLQNGNVHASSGVAPKSQVLNDFNVVSVTNSTTLNTSLRKSALASSNGLSKDFNLVQTPTKLRSHSESHGSTPPFKNASFNIVNRQNGKQSNDKSIPEISPRSRTNSNPPSFKYSLSTSTISSTSTTTSLDSLSNKFGPEFTELLTSHPDDNGFSVQVMAKLNETLTEITTLGTQLYSEREKVKTLMEEKAHMLGSMEDMTAEMSRSKKFKDEMEELMESTEGKLNSMREALEIEIQLRMAAEAKLNQLAQAQAALQRSILHSDKPDILQPLLTNYDY